MNEESLSAMAPSVISSLSLSSLPITMSVSAPHSPLTGLSPEDLDMHGSTLGSIGGVKPSLTTPDTWGAFGTQRDDAFDQVNHFSPNGLASPFPINRRGGGGSGGGGGVSVVGDNETVYRVRGQSIALDSTKDGTIAKSISGSGGGGQQGQQGQTELVRKLTLQGNDMLSYLQLEQDETLLDSSSSSSLLSEAPLTTSSVIDEIAWPEPELGGNITKSSTTLPSLKEGAEAIKEGITNIFSKIKL